MACKRWLVAVVIAIQIVGNFASESLERRNWLEDTSLPVGMIVGEGCTLEHQQYILPILNHTGNYLNAALSAVYASDQRLFRFFFQPNEKSFVARGLGKLSRILSHSDQNSVTLVCVDWDNNCDALNSFAQFRRFTQYETSKRTPRNNLIKLCPKFFTIPQVEVNPCDDRELDLGIPGTNSITASLVLLHELLHIPYLIGPKYDILRDITKDTYDSHALTNPAGYNMEIHGITREKMRPLWSVTNYVALAKWAWIQQQQLTQCPSNYPLWNVLGQERPTEKVELRRLLGEPDTPEAEHIDQSDVVSSEMSDGSSFTSQATFSTFNISGIVYSGATGLDFSQIRSVNNTLQESVTIEWTDSEASSSATAGTASASDDP